MPPHLTERHHFGSQAPEISACLTRSKRHLHFESTPASCSNSSRAFSATCPQGSGAAPETQNFPKPETVSEVTCYQLDTRLSRVSSSCAAFAHVLQQGQAVSGAVPSLEPGLRFLLPNSRATPQTRDPAPQKKTKKHSCTKTLKKRTQSKSTSSE